MPDATPSRRSRVLEAATCVGLTTLICLYALWRMDYFNPATEHHVRLTDNSRSAYVAKNLVDGNGYTTNDLPAALLDFYDERGKLHDAHWENADRFPFTAYAIAGLYALTGSSSAWVGILVYNLICFVICMLVLYRLALRIWGNRYSALLVLGIALLHPYTYTYLYLKDADMLMLTSAALALLYRYYERPSRELTWKLAVALGTVLTWLFLDRPNVGAPFIVMFAAVCLWRLRQHARAEGFSPAIRTALKREGLVALVALAWLAPFVVHSMREWGSPLFSANNLYQLPLGTRFGMGTDTWWKYTDPSSSLSFAMIADGAGDQLWSKMTSSWLATIKLVVSSFAIEMFLAFGLVVHLTRHRSAEVPSAAAMPSETPKYRPLRLIAATTGVALVLNLAVLPLYGYQNYAYRHYLGFGLPLLWLGAGHAIYLLARAIRPAFERLSAHWRANKPMWILVLVVGIVAWNFGAKSDDGNALFVRLHKFTAFHWLSASLIMLALLLHRWILRPPFYSKVVIVVVILIAARQRPSEYVKRLSLNFFPANEQVWSVLRERDGIVSSFALQGEVAWTSGRKNIPSPEFVMHLYSFAYDHHLEIEDVYIESAETMLGKFDGPFSKAAPGFEGYVRLQKYRGRLPGYEVVFHDSTVLGYPKYNVKPRPKASTVYRLSDREAIGSMRRSPDRIDVGDPANVVFTAHGFGDYYSIDGRSVVAATDVTRGRYTTKDEQPWEDTSVTFFLDERRPLSITVDLYAPFATTIQPYFDLDLYAYDRPSDRAAHALAPIVVTSPGWNRVVLEIPPGLARSGLNKLGFKSAQYQQLVLCSRELTDDACLSGRPFDETADPKVAARPMRLEGAQGITTARVSMFLASLEFSYAP